MAYALMPVSAHAVMPLSACAQEVGCSHAEFGTCQRTVLGMCSSVAVGVDSYTKRGMYRCAVRGKCVMWQTIEKVNGASSKTTATPASQKSSFFHFHLSAP